ncbi:hypothetical protein BJX68DRAFT_249494 [Aspergillus pseudodeflectus]|uniref:Rhodopsin domain-containing protein n=1 Tax=Aspergillus pseudodeflectus TaxID=176178 RepID=A0ABR4JCS0_9EURO
MPYSAVACVTTTLILYGLSCLALTLRFLNRFFLIHHVAVDDYLAALATVAYTVVAISYTVGLLLYGVGKQTSEVDQESYVVGLKIVFIGELLYFVATYLIKMSFAFTLLVCLLNQVILFSLLGSGLIVTLIAWFWALFFCRPVQYFWEQAGPQQAGPDPVQGSCKNISSLMGVLLAHAAWTLVADVTLGMVLPITLLWGSPMHWKLKISVYALLGLGSIASIATVVRIIYLPQVSIQQGLLTNNPVILWSIIETGVSIISTSVATMRRLLVRITRLSHSRHSEEEGSFSVSGGQRRHTQSGAAALAQHAHSWPCQPVELGTRNSSTDQILRGREYFAVTDKLTAQSSVCVEA